jgi:hypothetical protein
MKKIYLCAMALSVGSLSFAQQLNNKAFSESKLAPSIDNGIVSTLGSTSNSNKAPGDLIWSEDFTGGFPAGWNAIDNSSSNQLWVLADGVTLVQGEFTTDVSPIASASGGNYMLMNADGYNMPVSSGVVDIDSYFQTSAIPLTGQPNINVEFVQKFRRCCAINPPPEVILSVSTDPTFGTNVQSYDIIGGVDGNVTSADPMFMSINVSAIAGNVNGNIYLRFHMKSGNSHYYWMIDDITVVETQLNDLITTSPSVHFFGVEYTRIPSSQIQPMGASMIYNNNGSVEQTNSNLTATIDDGTTPVILSSPNQDIPSLEVDTIGWDSLWTPSNIAGTNYTVTLDIFSEDSTDITPGNNTATLQSFQITDGIMALDDYSTTPGSRGSGTNNGNEYEAGNQFDCTADAPLYAIELVTGDGTPITQTFIDVVLYLADFSSGAAVYTELWRSAGYEITAADINTPKKFYDIAGTPIYNMISGETYIAAVHSYINYEYATSGIGPNPGTPTASHSIVNYPNFTSPAADATFSLTSTPMIRLDLQNTLLISIEDGKSTSNFTVYPNPSNGEFTINLSGEAKISTLTVKNVVGQTIINKTVNVAGNTTETISLSDYSKGVYFLTVDGETTKLIVE